MDTKRWTNAKQGRNDTITQKSFDVFWDSYGKELSTTWNTRGREELNAEIKVKRSYSVKEKCPFHQDNAPS